MSRMFSYFDPTGVQLGETFPMTTTAPSSGVSDWANVVGQVATGALDFLKTREQRKLEQSYVAASQVPPSSILNPGGASYAVGQSNPWPLIALAGGALLLLSKK